MQNENDDGEIDTPNLQEVSAASNLDEQPALDYEPPPKRPALSFAYTDPIHTGHDQSTIELQHQLRASKVKIVSLKKKLKVSQQRTRRLKKKVTSLEEIVKQLRQNNLVSSNCEELLNQTFSGVPLALMKRMSAKKSGKGSKYTSEMKSFALTLQFYSTKAYEFVRKTFNIALPSQSQIRRWYGKVAADPGFTKPAFNALKVKAEDAEKNGKKLICSLMMDEMAIKKHVSWNGQKFTGYVDLGNGINDDSLPVAADALVFMVVSVDGSWKVPCGYFFVNGLSGEERANLVKVCIERLSDVGVKVISLTCDGPSCHFSMLSTLGASLHPSKMIPYFPHPQNKDEKIWVLLDVCHMLKLVRNTLAEKGIILDKNNGKILWQYLVELEKLQAAEGLRLGNKLKQAHIKWAQQKMKVNLAAQSLSSSVADAIEYCTKTLKLPQFQGSEATVKFLRVIDRLFDLLNSRNPFGRGYKAPLRASNKTIWEPCLDETYKYISGLKSPDGMLMTSTWRKTGFVGFLAAIKSTKQLFHELVGKENAPLEYLLTYKLSQDHLELFFAAVRSAGGFNNNPTTEQFTAAYKRLLTRSHIEGGKGNCKQRDPIEILSAIGDSSKVNGKSVTITTAALIRKYDLQQRVPMQCDHDYSDAPNMVKLSEYKTAAISYISGYVAKSVQQKILCDDCRTALGSQDNTAPSSEFLKLKDSGKLFKPASSVVNICNESEKCFERMLAKNAGKLPHGKGIPEAIATVVLGTLKVSSLFTELDDHMFDWTVDDNHVYKLIKKIVKCYCKVRLYHLGKETTADLSGEKIRKKLNKLVLFKHQ